MIILRLKWSAGRDIFNFLLDIYIPLNHNQVHCAVSAIYVLVYSTISNFYKGFYFAVKKCIQSLISDSNINIVLHWIFVQPLDVSWTTLIEGRGRGINYGNPEKSPHLKYKKNLFCFFCGLLGGQQPILNGETTIYIYYYYIHRGVYFMTVSPLFFPFPSSFLPFIPISSIFFSLFMFPDSSL